MPTGHGTQLVALAWLEKEPALQTAGATLPAVHALPGGQSRQTEADVPPSSGEYRLGGHWVGALAPSAQKEPAVHVSHCSCPSSSWYLPASHLGGIGLGLGLTVGGRRWAVGGGRRWAGGTLAAGSSSLVA